MLKYFNNHQELFQNAWMPFLICLMQLTSGVIAEMINFLMLCSRTSVEWCITFFVAFRVLVNVDNIYYEAMPETHLKEEVNEPLPVFRKSKHLPFRQRNKKGKCIYILEGTCKV